ncbi:exonuclease [Dictyocaulus viviparus]|uniref:Exonuclease n=1 Tax=Dictyocaulus viviparus TaxID=29172 RepID=A0A0D8XYR6_DICVI|nr:exonuclease [Dictyocaulus viviparus]
MGSISEEEVRAIDEAESATASQVFSSSMDSSNSQDVNNYDHSMKLSRKLATAKYQRLPGPQLMLTLSRLGGVLISHAEVRDLVQYSVVGPIVNKPKWAHFGPWRNSSQTDDNEYSFTFIDEFFEKRWIRMDSAVSDREEFWNHMMNVPIGIKEQIRERVLMMDSLEDLEKCAELKTQLLITTNEMVNNGYPFPDHSTLATKEKCVFFLTSDMMDSLEDLEKCAELKTQLLITTNEMVNNGYPFPDHSTLATKEKYSVATKDSPLFALDCEMCLTSAGCHELTRISIVREDGSVVLDTLVKPENEITDYLTKYSGITPKLMDSVTTSLKDVQAAIRAVLPSDAILCGHSLEFDFRSMRMAHPYCIDIGLIYNISGNTRLKTSLKNLMALFFNEEIQNTGGHCSVEDAWCAMRLLKLKLEKGLVFGNCRYGWNYAEWSKCKGSEAKADEQCEPVPKKVARLSPRERRFCACGELIGVECIIQHCQCQKSPPTECIKCLANNVVSSSEANFDWSNALREDYCDSYRPLSYYLIDMRKTVMCGFTVPNQINIQKCETFKVRRPESFPSIARFVDEVSCDILEYGLALVEIDFVGRQNEYSSEEDEEGEVCDGRWRMQKAVNELDGHVEKIIRAAARFSLIIIVMSSSKSSICYLKVKQ